MQLVDGVRMWVRGAFAPENAGFKGPVSELPALIASTQPEGWISIVSDLGGWRSYP